MSAAFQTRQSVSGRMVGRLAKTFSPHHVIEHPSWMSRTIFSFAYIYRFLLLESIICIKTPYYREKTGSVNVNIGR